jgi:transposase
MGIENIWNQAKGHLRHFHVIRKETFPLYLKECEWRFHGGTHNQLLTQLKSWTKAHDRFSYL